MKTIFISAGEASGDLLGATLARTLLQKDPSLQLVGMGGHHMQAAGVSIAFSYEKLSVIGLIESIKQLPSILSLWRAIKKYFTATKPDLVILIDSPDTHFRFLKTLKKLGIPVLYYVSPQIWAWRYSRIYTMKKYVNHVAALFAFEEKLYQKENIPVTFVGHPLASLVKPTMSADAAYDFFKLDRHKKIIALFPGSRHSELKNHLSLMITAAQRIRKKQPDTQFVLVLAKHFDEKQIRETMPDYIFIIQDHLYDLLSITTAAVAVSGTVTLEIALMQVPLCIIYRMHPFSFWIAKQIIRTNHIGLCNIISERSIVKEFIQEKATADNIADEINLLLTDKKYYCAIQNDFRDLKQKIARTDQSASEKVAEITDSIFANQ